MVTITSIERITTASDGSQGNGASTLLSLSADGTIAYFSSSASNLVSGDGNSTNDIFAKNLITGEVTRLTVNELGQESGTGQFAPVFGYSVVGNQLFFDSRATNLDPDYTVVAQDNLYVKNLQTGDVTLLSVRENGTVFDQRTTGLDVNSNGTQVAFTTQATEVVSGVTSTRVQLYTKDLATGDINILSIGTDGNPANNNISQVTYLTDNIVLFSSNATNLTNDGVASTSVSHIYAANITTGQITLLSKNGSGQLFNGSSANFSASADGSKLLFTSTANNAVAGDTNGFSDVFIRDMNSGEITRVSLNEDGLQTDRNISFARISPDGTKIAFTTASNVYAGVNEFNDNVEDVYIKDLVSGDITKVTTLTGSSLNATINRLEGFTPDGNGLIITTLASNLVANDTNNVLDSFIIRFEPEAEPITGDAGDNTLAGTTGNDTIEGLAGNDTLTGDAGDDTIYGGDNNDVINGGAGNNVLNGGNGADIYVITGDAGTTDIIEDFSVVDDKIDLTAYTTITSFDDLTITETDAVYITLADKTVKLAGVTLALLTAANFILNEPEPEPITGDAGDNTLAGTTGNDTIEGLAGNDTLTGDAGDDTIYGGDNNDVINGGAGNNVLNGGNGADVFIITADTGTTDIIQDFSVAEDKIDLTAFTSIMDFADLAITETDAVYITLADKTVKLAGVTLASLTAANFVFYDDGIPDEVGVTLQGGDASETLTGTAYKDSIAGGKGADTITGLADNDTLDGGYGHDSILAGEGNDYVTGDYGWDYLEGNDGDDTLIGGRGRDTLLGGLGADSIEGNEGRDTIDGGTGNDTILAGRGWDYVSGGDGDDIILGERGRDTITGGSGNDSINGGFGHDLISGDEDAYAAAQQSGGDDIIYGAEGHDTIYGKYGNDTLLGGIGKDKLYGDAGADQLSGEYGDDNLYGGTGNDNLSGGEGRDVLFGGDGTDLLEGGEGRDTLYGDAGNDVILGGEGTDVLIGGADDGLANIAVTPGSKTFDTILHNGGTQAVDVNDVSDIGDIVTVGARSLTANQITFLGRLADGDALYRVNNGSDVTVNWVLNNTSKNGVDFALTISADSAVIVNVGNVPNGVAFNLQGIGAPKSTATSGNSTISVREIQATGTIDSFTFGDTLTGGINKDIFVYGLNDGVDLITDFEVGKDKLDLGHSLKSLAEIVSFGTSGDTTILFKDGAGGYLDNAAIVLDNVTVNNLNLLWC